MLPPKPTVRVLAARCRFALVLAAALLACNSTQKSTLTVEDATGIPTAHIAPPAPHPKTIPVEQGQAAVERIISAGRNDSKVQEHLEHLCKAIGPRLTGSTNVQHALDWCREQFASFGLRAELEHWGEFAVGFDRGPARGGMVAPEQRDYQFITSAWTPGTGGPKRGPALMFPADQAALDALKGKLGGAWVVRAASTSRSFRRNPFDEDVRKAMVAEGALGEIRGSRNDLLVMGGNHDVKWDDLPKRVSITLKADDHKDLCERIGRGEPVELEFDVDNRFVQGPVPQYNVVAELRGTEKPDEYVIVCGHLDSWDGAEGAVDNGTGCATTIEAARLLVAAHARPKRSIRFCLWTGEEQGLFGSQGYVRDHADELSRISAVLNHDEGTNYLAGLSVTYEMETAMREAVAPVLALDTNMPFTLAVADGLNGRPDSDHWSFIEKGVPGFFWDQKGKADYEHCHHTQFDTFDAAIPEYQQHSAIVAAVVAYDIANLPDLLDRTNMAPVEPRRMGVDLDGNTLTMITPSGKAADAGWKTGDVIVSIDGVAVNGRQEIVGELQKGGPQKKFVLKRGEEMVETLLDYSNDPGEQKRAERAAARPPSTSK
jgi:hypothetical protein